MDRREKMSFARFVSTKGVPIDIQVESPASLALERAGQQSGSEVGLWLDIVPVLWFEDSHETSVL